MGKRKMPRMIYIDLKTGKEIWRDEVEITDAEWKVFLDSKRCEIDFLCRSLLPQMQDFFESEAGKAEWKEHLRLSGKNDCCK